jgi:lipopolysaccharide transport system ATP-binding protein
MSDFAIKVEGLGKKYLIKHQAESRRYVALRDVLADRVKSLFQNRKSEIGNRKSVEEFWALKDVSFEVKSGEAVGIIGRNGAGKSTLLKLLSRITEPTAGRIRLRGRVASLLEVGTGFHPELTGRENIFLNGAILGMHRAEIKKKFDEIVAFAEVEKFLDTPVKRYSSGMYMRLAFAVAAHLEPEILIVDEVLAVGDAQFQKKCLGKMEDVSKGGRTVLFVSHNLQAIRQLCGRVVLLKQGQIAFSGEPHTGITGYLNQGNEAGLRSNELSAYRRHSGPEIAKLTNVKFLNAQGQPVGRMEKAGELVVEAQFVVETPVNSLDIPMAIVHADGTKIFSEAYSDQFSKLRLERGDYAVRFSIPLKFFKLESYSLILGLFDHSGCCDIIEGLPLPELFDDRADPHMEAGRLGFMRVPVEWDAVKPMNADSQ